MRIYLPEKSERHQGRKAEVTITFKGCSLGVTCWVRADLLAVMFVVFCHFPKCILGHIRIKGEVCAVSLV